MSDLHNFVQIIAKTCHNYSVDEFYSVTRVQVKTHKFTNWMGLFTNKNAGIPMSMIYVFDKDGNFLSSALST